MGLHQLSANHEQPFPSSRRKEKASKNGKKLALAACDVAFDLNLHIAS
jgi:hypothetical protein